MSTITVLVTNADPRNIDLEVTMIDNFASDPAKSEKTAVIRPGVPYEYTLTDTGQGGSIEWTATADGYPDGGPTTQNGLPDGDPVNVAAG
jgi:hypothetical protein